MRQFCPQRQICTARKPQRSSHCRLSLSHIASHFVTVVSVLWSRSIRGTGQIRRLWCRFRNVRYPAKVACNHRSQMRRIAADASPPLSNPSRWRSTAPPTHDSKRDVVVKVAGVFSLRRCGTPLLGARGRFQVHRAGITAAPSRASACRWRRSRSRSASGCLVVGARAQRSLDGAAWLARLSRELSPAIANFPEDDLVPFGAFLRCPLSLSFQPDTRWWQP